MSWSKCCWSLGMAGLLCSASARSAEDKPKDEPAGSQAAGTDKTPSPEDIAKLVQQLDADQFGQREAAVDRLAAIGKAAIPAVTEVALGESLEASTRAVDVLRRLFESSDEPTKAAAKEALEKVVKGSNPSAGRRAHNVLQPKPDPNQPQQVPLGGIIIGPGQGGIIQGNVQIMVGAAGVNAKRVSIKTVNGVKEVDAEENGKRVKITDDPKAGIKMEITTKKDGKDNTEKFEAKNAEELKQKHPKAYETYKQYAQQQGGGAAAIQFQFGPGNVPAPPVPPPPPQPQPGAAPAVKAAGSSIDTAAMLVKHWTEQIARLTADEQLKSASKESREELQKRIAELKQQLADLEKRLQK